jgi:hypothetical protein
MRLDKFCEIMLKKGDRFKPPYFLTRFFCSHVVKEKDVLELLQDLNNIDYKGTVGYRKFPHPVFFVDLKGAAGVW